MITPLTIWTNAGLPDAAQAILLEKVAPHRLVRSPSAQLSNLVPGSADPALAGADVAFGQPDPQQVIDSAKLKWVHLSSAGYTRYDTAAMRSAIQARGGILSNSSGVFDEPCAEHLAAMIYSLARHLPRCLIDQTESASWNYTALRSKSKLLTGQTGIIYGYGAIAQRLVDLLVPLKMKLTGVRRRARGDESVPIVTSEQADHLLPQMDHVIDILPASPETDLYFNSGRLALLKPGANFYNIGRGSTVDQPALIEALNSAQLGAAYLDVTTPEPLPPDDPLWRTTNCYITPHTAGGHVNEFERLVLHFLANLERYSHGVEVLNRIF